jgi:hypothetical protein
MGVASWWAVDSTLLAPTQHDARESKAPVQVQATSMEIGRSLSLNVTVTQPFTTPHYADSTGKITAMTTLSAVSSGDVLVTVDAVPVVAISGDMPFYRDMTKGVSGVDVVQLRSFLKSSGLISDGTSPAFDFRVEAAVKKWQRTLGVPQTGAVPLASVLAVPSLPRAFQFAEDVALGAPVLAAEPLIFTHGSEGSKFSISVTKDQAALISADATVEVRLGESTWPAVVSGRADGENGGVELRLEGPGGGAVCGDTCGLLPTDEVVSLLSSISVVPKLKGVGVPVAAIHQGTDGATYVMSTSGAKVPIAVLGSDSGFAIVSGVDDGEKIVVFGSSK